MLFRQLLIFFFWKNYFNYTIRVSNSLGPDQARQNVGPDLGPNCLQKLATDDTSRQRFDNYLLVIPHAGTFNRYVVNTLQCRYFCPYTPTKTWGQELEILFSRKLPCCVST